MKILVTGAGGYLGEGIVKNILDRGYEVIATDINVKDIDDRAVIKKCDIFNIQNPYEYFGYPDAVLHLAWRDGFIHYSDSHINDLPKHFKFLKELAENGIRQIAVMGSMHEIGFYEGSINELTPCNPITPYGIGKNTLRELVAMICRQHNIIFQWLRAYYIVGNSRSGCSIFSKIAQAEKAGKQEFPFTLGQNQYDFLDYDNFCIQVSACVTQRKEQGIIEICSGYPEKLADRVERFIKENNFKIRLKYGAFPDRPYDSKALWGDNKKIRKILNTLE